MPPSETVGQQVGAQVYDANGELVDESATPPPAPGAESTDSYEPPPAGSHSRPAEGVQVDAQVDEPGPTSSAAESDRELASQPSLKLDDNGDAEKVRIVDRDSDGNVTGVRVGHVALGSDNSLRFFELKPATPTEANRDEIALLQQRLADREGR